MKQAVLAVSFGTSHRDTLEKTIAAVERDLAEAFPGWEVRRAFTSGKIMKKLKERDGLEIDTVERALERLASEGFERVVVQPSHIINGAEFDKLLAQAAPYREKFKGFAVGAPLLTSIEDYQAAAKAICDILPPQEDKKAVVLMGHGTAHHANSAYPALEYVLHDLGRTDVFIGTVEGYPAFEHALKQVKAREAAAVTLIPLMVVAGEHAVHDMAGDEPDSWKNQLSAAGCQVRWTLQGLGEVAAIRKLFVAHAAEAKASLR